MDRQALSRRQPRYMLDRVVDVVGDRLGRALPPAAEVTVRPLRPMVAIELRPRAVVGRSGLIHQRGPHGVHGVVARPLVWHGSGSLA